MDPLFYSSHLLEPHVFWILIAAVIVFGILGPWTNPRKQRQLKIPCDDDRALDEQVKLKDMYFKLQNLEYHTDIIPDAKELLLSFLSKTLVAAQENQPHILSVEEYSSERLDQFLRHRRQHISHQWLDYLQRRKSGGPAELMPTVDVARRWLERQAPLRLVDGAWLGWVNRITTPFDLRPITIASWLMLSEELGDGVPERNHVLVYSQLLEKVGIRLPAPDSMAFGRAFENEDTGIWRAAVTQLLISLFSQEFLPELLGFSLHFEEATLETMQAAKELRELRLDPQYFALHICIDNAASGHAAMAQQIVVNYLEHVRRTAQASDVQIAWKRVQAGFLLSENISHLRTTEPFPRSDTEAKFLHILKDKARASYGIHGASKARIGQRTLSEWLDPSRLGGSPEWQRSFLDALAGSRVWVRRGDPDASLLFRELTWGGKMFGAFTRREVAVLRRWIESLAQTGDGYCAFTGRKSLTPSSNGDEDVTALYSGLSLAHVPDPISTTSIPPGSDIRGCEPVRFAPGSSPVAAVLLPLWFTHTCLLESFVTVPCRTTDALAAAILRCMRAQLGVDADMSGVSGIDESSKSDRICIVELGLELASKLGTVQPLSLWQVLDTWPQEFASQMLHVSLRPLFYKALLLGMAWAFVDLHEAVAILGVFDADKQKKLECIAQVERENLSEALKEVCRDRNGEDQALKGYFWARKHVEACFVALAS